MAEFLLLVVDRVQLPQLADDPFETVSVALPQRLPSFGDELRGATEVRAVADASGALLEFGFPCSRVAKIRRPAQAPDDAQLPFDVVRIPSHKRPFAGLVRADQRRSLGLVAVGRHPTDRDREFIVDFFLELGPGLVGFDLGQQGVEVRELAARLLAGVEVAAAGRP